MSSTDYSAADRSRGYCFNGHMGSCGRGHWSGANIVAMVLGFILFPPLGFIVLLWTILGHPIQELPGWVRDKWNQMFRKNNAGTYKDSENIVFNEYQQTQYDRIREIKEEIKKRTEAFRSFRFDAKRRKDQEEFDEFMANKPADNNDAH
ncbi:DUF2852 domain-containing protein [Candidatus Thiodiazotropha sp. CDECU1]|uniref:DUF2852 domain-containing protein n=1 Tax=Candidatus Thiodiazotropha sp. CDECU1 TaxID=3065865 RepID=UPI00292FBB71|nr:DUF2852 domain-containing protein [Candidatus Thiodiazotropha sp. CDECU1]